MGVGSFFLSEVITDAMKEQNDAFFFAAPNMISQKLATKISLKEFNYIKYESYGLQYPKFKTLEGIEDVCKGYLVLFKDI